MTLVQVHIEQNKKKKPFNVIECRTNPEQHQNKTIHRFIAQKIIKWLQ